MNTIIAAPFGPSGTHSNCANQPAKRTACSSTALNKTLAITASILLLSSRAFAPILMFLDSPQDDRTVRRALLGCGVSESNSLNRCVVLQPLEEEYQRLIQTRIWPLTRAGAAKYFGPTLITATNWWARDKGIGGPQIGKHPDDLVSPLFAGNGLMVSGLHSTDPTANKNHTDLHAIGKLGYIELYYGTDGETVQTAVLYNRADKQFVPLKSPDDFEKRLEWDKARFALLKKWLDEHLPRIKDLGEVDVSEAAPSRVSLDKDRTCIIKTQINRHPNVTNDWYSLTLSLDPPEAAEAKRQYVFRSIDRPNTVIGFAFDGDFFQMTPKLQK